MITSKYFKEAEFKKCCPSCSLQDMDQAFMNKLDKTRELAGIPFLLSSAYRSPAWDKYKGRSGNGDHTQGCGVDVVCNSSVTRMKILKAAIELGWTRIGVSSTFIHIGSGHNLPENVIWLY